MKTAKLITACILISGMLPFTDLSAKDDTALVYADYYFVEALLKASRR